MFILVDIIFFVSIFLPVLFVMAFITLLERKVMGTMQRRRGPNVVGFFGILQPFADGIKLLVKEPVFPYQSDMMLFVISPLVTFFISLVGWSIIPLSEVSLDFFAGIDLQNGVFFLLAVSSLGVYGILLAGWSSNSKYAFFGAIRSAAQMISYEVAMTLSVFPILCCVNSFSLVDIVVTQRQTVSFIWVFPPAALFFIISILAETNRSPFDLPEAEGELVAGYNVEFSAFFFALFYLSEYINILLLSTVFVVLFLGGSGGFLVFVFKVFCVVYFIIWVRATLPRYRYDQLMSIGWKVLLPLTTAYALFTVGVLISVNYLIGFSVNYLIDCLGWNRVLVIVVGEYIELLDSVFDGLTVLGSNNNPFLGGF